MRKSTKRIFVFLLLTVLLAGTALPVIAAEEENTVEEKAAEELHIRDLDDFLTFTKRCVRDRYSQNMTVYLETDLDLKDVAFRGIPIFSGTFEGNLHTVENMDLTAQGSTQGFFRYLTEDAAVNNLVIQGTLHPEGSQNEIGGLAGSNAGTIRNCRFHGDISGAESVGGLVGINQISGILENCRSSGTIRGTHFVGGCAGNNLGIIRSCKNRAGINVNEDDNNIHSVTLSPEYIMGKETAETVTDLGGIAGTSTGVIRDCTNVGNVGYPHMGYNVGGIAGSQRGYIAECKNYGSVQGRKEVAGIAGQMEPVAKIHYTPDTLQILRGQLATTASLANSASSHIRGGADDIAAEISSLHDQAGMALDAVGQLFPSEDGFPDWDTVIAANNALSSSISSMQNIASSLHGSIEATVSTAAGDIQGITRQVTAMSHTLDTAAENLGGTIVDVSDSDTPEDYTGKVEACENYGFILGDLNIGGIAGAIAWENDKDPEGDFEVTGDRSLNFDSELRSVILNSHNHGTVSAKKKNAGGIAGNMTLGLVRDCTNVGALDCEEADCVGGIAGISNGFIRNSSAKCLITAHAYVGGIAGQAPIVSDCRSIVKIRDGGEKLGSVLGRAVDHHDDTENPITGNYYLPLADHLGAVDGIDYYGIADAASQKQFLSIPDLPEMFREAVLTFRYPDGKEETLTVPLGQVVPEYKIPALPRKEGSIAAWKGLDEIDLRHVFLDAVLEVEYTPCHTSVQSDLKRDDGKPILLAEGKFSTQDPLSLTACEDLPAGALEGWTLPRFRTDDTVLLHLSVPGDLKPESAKVLIQDQNGQWRKADASEDGSYLVFAVTQDDQAIAIQKDSTTALRNLLIYGGAAVGAAAILVLVLVHRRRKKKSNTKSR